MSPLETIIFSLLAGGVGAFLGAYLQQKGKNFATREDVSEITQKVESVKTDLAARQHFSQIRYEREMKVFEEIWPQVCELQAAVLSLRPAWDSGLKEGETADSRKKDRIAQFNTALNNFRLTINQNRPFYPPVIWNELQELLKLSWGEAVEFSIFEPRSDKDYWSKAMNNAEAINTQISKTSDAIRNRLSKFDSI